MSIARRALGGWLVGLNLPQPAWGTERALRLATAAFPPFRIQDAQGLRGSDTDIVRLVFERLGVALQIDVLPPRRAMAEGARGQAYAGFFSFTRTAEREREFFFSEPLSAVVDVFFKRRADPIAWRDFSDLEGLRVGYSAGYAYAPEFQRAVAEGAFSTDPVTLSEPELVHLRKLQADRIDLAICERSVCGYLLANHPQLRAGVPLDAIDRPIGALRSFHLALSRQWPGAEALCKAFNAELLKVDREGLRPGIYARYGMKLRLPLP